MSNVEILSKFIEDEDLFLSTLKIRRGERTATYILDTSSLYWDEYHRKQKERKVK